MKQSKIPSTKIMKKHIFIILSLCLILTLLTSFRFVSEPTPAKIKFSSMVMKKTDLIDYTSMPNFSHFIFQNVNLDNTSGRNSFELIVYAYDSNGKQLNPNPRLLKTAKFQPNPPVNERIDNIYFGNYTMSKSQYELITSGYSNFDSLKFVAVSINDGQTYPNYVTYQVLPVIGPNETIATRVKIMVAGSDYLKPSPPAPPPTN